MSTELSGVDLARQALLAAQATAKKTGAGARRPKRCTGTTMRRDGREPLGLGAAITAMMTEGGMVAPADGGSVLAQFDAVVAAAASELTGHVEVVASDPDAGRLDVAPDSPATAAVTSAPQPAMPADSAKRRAPPEGYRRAIDAHHQAFQPPQLDPAIAAAMEGQTAAMRELSGRAFPEPPAVFRRMSRPRSARPRMARR